MVDGILDLALRPAWTPSSVQLALVDVLTRAARLWSPGLVLRLRVAFRSIHS